MSMICSMKSPFQYKNFISDPKMNKQTAKSVTKVVGKIVLKLNSDLLDLIKEYKNAKEEVPLSVKGVQLQESIDKQKKELEEILKNFEDGPDFLDEQKSTKTLAMIKMNIDTANKVLESNGPLEGKEAMDKFQGSIEESRQGALNVMKEVEEEEKIAEENIKELLTTNQLNAAKNNEGNEGDKKIDHVERELAAIDAHQAERVRKMKKEIKEKMKFHKEDLLKKWKDQKNVLDYQALKEYRSDMESTHRGLRHMVNEWDRRRLSDILSDDLMDTIDNLFDEYMVEFRRMDEEKRMEAALLRKRNLEVEEYRKEKRRNIPTWPKSMIYTKFKPD